MFELAWNSSFTLFILEFHPITALDLRSWMFASVIIACKLSYGAQPIQ